MSTASTDQRPEGTPTPRDDVSEVSPAGVRVRYWAAARAAVGTPEEEVVVPAAGQSVAEVLARVADGRDARVAQVLAICSVLVDERAVHASQLGGHVVRPGAVLDLLPPFAGG